MLVEIAVDVESGRLSSERVDGLQRFGKELAVQRMAQAEHPEQTLYLAGYAPTAASGVAFAGELNLYGISRLGCNLQGSRSGGLLGCWLARAGVVGIRVQGRCAQPQVLLLDPRGRPSLRTLASYGGPIAGTRELAHALYREHGSELAVAVVDPATVGFRYGAVVCNRSPGGVPDCAAARGSTIFGANGLVAVAMARPEVDPSQGRDPAGLRTLQARLARSRTNKDLAGSKDPAAPLLGGTYGAAARGRLEQGYGLTNLFRDAHVPAEVLEDLLPEHLARGQLRLAERHSAALSGHGCVPGCPNRRAQPALMPSGDGGAQAMKAGEWETCQGLINLGVFEGLVEQAAWVLEHSNTHAYDHIEALVTLAALALASEGGRDSGVRFGDWASQRSALEQAVAGRSELGQLIRLGAAAVERRHGLERHFTVGGHALPFHNPRALPQTGVGLSWTFGHHGGCCAGPGRHNFLGLPYDPADHALPPEAHVLNAMHAMVLYGAMDAASHRFFRGPSLATLAKLELLHAELGVDYAVPDVLRRSAHTLLQVQAMNAARGVEIQPLPRVFYERATHGCGQGPQRAVAFTVPFPMVRDLGLRALEGVASGRVTVPPALLAEERTRAEAALG